MGAIAFSVFWAPSASRAQESEAVTLAVLDVFDARFVPGGWMPLSLQVDSSRAVRGQVVISSPGEFGGRADHVQALEVPGGGSKRMDLLVRAPRGGEIQIEFSDDEGVIAATEYQPVVVDDEVVVGLLQADAPTLDGMELEPTLQEVTAVELDPQLLQLGPHALDPLAYVVVEPDVLGQLPDDHREALLDWVLLGGRMVTAGGASEPGAKEVAGTGVAIAERGLGQLITMPDLSAADRAAWATAIRPTPGSGRASNQRIFDNFGQPPDPALVNALNEGRSNVGIAWFLGFLVAYLIAVGPLNYYVFKRRGSRELLWLSVPILSLAFSGVAYGLARETRGGTSVRSGGAVLATQHGSSGEVVVTVTSGGGGPRSIGFAGSPASAVSLNLFGSDSGEAITTTTPEGSVVSFESSPFAVSAAAGPADITGFLDASLRTVDGSLQGEVTNRSDLDLVEGGVLYEHRVYPIAELEAGATATIDAPLRRQDARFFRPLVRGRVKGALMSQLNKIVGPMWLFEQPVVFGYAKEARVSVAIDGRQREQAARLLIASPVDVEPDPGGGPIELPGDSAAIEGPRGMSLHGGANLSLDGFRELTLVQPLPSSVLGRVRDAQLSLAGDHGALEVEVYDWSEQEWRTQNWPPRLRRFTVDISRAQISPAGEIYYRIEADRHRFLNLHDIDLRVTT